ncbi:MAG: CDP-diacylglycerol--glycerol-3-phosphate 3-phosphatidyltransferase [Proteobacteria bacterium]|nr:CDP-diacylglycerol--glycerol-3-phosphate 3-phosphatidyltransferase [Pseudomonadota bacterium]
MNIPNFLSLIRIFLVPVLVIFLIQGSFLNALIVFVVAGITDALDGFFARILKQKTVLGAYLDPLADKALLISTFVTLSILGMIPAWLTVIVVSRDFVILLGVSVLFFMSVSFEIRPAFVSKITTTLQLLTLFLVLALRCMPADFNCPLVEVAYWVTALFTVISGLNYVAKGVKFINSVE